MKENNQYSDNGSTGNVISPTPLKLGASVLVTAMVMTMVAGLWHEVIAPQLYSTTITDKHQGTTIIFIAYILLAAVMVIVYNRKESITMPVVQGLFTGILIGFVWVFPHELAMAAAHGESFLYVVKNGVWHLIEQGIGGVVIGLMLGKSR